MKLTKQMQALADLLHAEKNVCHDIMESEERNGRKGETLYEIEASEACTLGCVLALIEDPKHFDRIAEIYAEDIAKVIADREAFKK